MSLVFLLGIFGTSAILLYFTFNLEMKEHPFLRFILVMFAFLLLLFVPKALLDDKTVCGIVVVNETAVNATLTHYDYDNVCFTEPGRTHVTFMKIINWLFYIFIGYVIIIILLKGLEELMSMYRRGRV